MKSRFIRFLKQTAQFLLIFVLISGIIDHIRRPEMPHHAAHQPFTTYHHTAPDTLANISQNHTVLLYFWGSWCGICRHTSPAIEALHRDGVRVIGVAMHSGNDAQIRAHLQQNGWTFDTLNDERGHFAQSWHIHATPSIILIRNGKISHSTTGLASYWGLKLRLMLLN